MKLSRLSWSVFGCALYIFGTSLGDKRIPSTKEIEKLEHEIEEVLSRRKGLYNDPIAKDESVNAPDALNENQLRNRNRGPRTENSWKFRCNCIPEYGLSDCNFKERQTKECSNVNSIVCNPNALYRTFDGSCNNLRRPHLGQAGSCHRRILAAQYDDNREKPKTYNGQLPNPRAICFELHRDSMRRDYTSRRGLSSLFLAFGQFIDHDLTLTSVVTLPNNTALPCCPIKATNNKECFPIPLQNDPDFRGNCMNFSRSNTCRQCVVEQRQQLNALTPFMDCSHIYGLTADEAKLLRGGKPYGKLNTTLIGSLELLPQNVNASPQCGSTCFRTGDTRSNQNMPLTMMHTIWVLFHNCVVDTFRKAFPTWGEEKLYNETRKYLTCCFQHISYSQYLPILLGEAVMYDYCLLDNPSEYDDNCDPRTVNEAMTAAFRLHSTVMNNFLSLREDGMYEIIPFSNNFFNVTPFYMGKLPDIARGSFRQPQLDFDPLLAESVTKFLYLRSNATPPALDLCSLNIQRGRDHGLPGYTAYLLCLFNIKINNFKDLEGILYSECISKYQELYSSVHHIDLWSALQCEIIGPSALVGKVGRELLALQFEGTKYGDRFFWTHGGQPWSLTKQQKNAVMPMTIGVICCLVFGSNLKSVPTNVFFSDSPLTSCGNPKDILLKYLSQWEK